MKLWQRWSLKYNASRTPLWSAQWNDLRKDGKIPRYTVDASNSDIVRYVASFSDGNVLIGVPSIEWMMSLLLIFHANLIDLDADVEKFIVKKYGVKAPRTSYRRLGKNAQIPCVLCPKGMAAKGQRCAKVISSLCKAAESNSDSSLATSGATQGNGHEGRNSRKDGVEDNTPSGSKKEDNSVLRRHGKVAAQESEGGAPPLPSSRRRSSCRNQ